MHDQSQRRAHTTGKGPGESLPAVPVSAEREANASFTCGAGVWVGLSGEVALLGGGGPAEDMAGGVGGLDVALTSFLEGGGAAEDMAGRGWGRVGAAASTEEEEGSVTLLCATDEAAQASLLLTVMPASGSLAFFCSLFSLLRSFADSLLMATAPFTTAAVAVGRLAVLVVVAEA